MIAIGVSTRLFTKIQTMKRAAPVAWNKGRPLKITKVSVVPTQPALNPNQRTQVARMIRKDTELKSWTVAVAITALSSTATIVDLSQIAVGTSDNTRIGNHVHLKRFNLRFQLFGSDATNTFRIIIFKWKDNDFYTGAPAGTAILSALTGGAGDVLAPYNREVPEAFVILKDMLITSSQVSDPCISRNISIPLKGKAQYVGAGTTGLGKVYMLMLSDSTVVAHPTITYWSELLYLDD